MQIRTALTLALLLAALAAGCARDRADLGTPYTTAAGPGQVEESPGEFRQVFEAMRPFAIGGM